MEGSSDLAFIVNGLYFYEIILRGGDIFANMFTTP